MKKVVIVGAEGSGKTVMLAGIGDLYVRPDKRGYFLSPKDYSTVSYVADRVARLKEGEWPAATAEDVMQGLNWTLRRQMPSGSPEDVCEVSFLDFAGEVYRSAFGANENVNGSSEERKALREYIKCADDVIVLVNLKDVIAKGTGDAHVRESVWITKRILDFALNMENGHQPPQATIVLSQADSYAETIRNCGGAKKVLAKYLPYVAGDYGWLDTFQACAVDKTHLTDEGVPVPETDFTFEGLRPIMERIIADVARSDRGAWRPFGRALGSFVLAIATAGMSWIGFEIGLSLWDLSHQAVAVAVVSAIANVISTDLICLGVCSLVAFVSFLLAVCLKPSPVSWSRWHNRFVLSLFVFGLSLSAPLVFKFSSLGDTANVRAGRPALFEKFKSSREEYRNAFLTIVFLDLALTCCLAFGCDSGKGKKSL